MKTSLTSRRSFRVMHATLFALTFIGNSLLGSADILYGQSGAPEWKSATLSTLFYAEGGSVADFDGDGHNDVFAGPRIFFGPDYASQVAIGDSKTYNINGYSDNFFGFDADIDRDGDTDILIQGFPGAAAHWYRNPGPKLARSGPWERFAVMDVVDNESPMFTDVTGDGIPELVCIQDAKFGYAEIPADPTAKWAFHPVSEPGPYQRFTHGIGTGDVNDDGRIDILSKDGWWEHPQSITSAVWVFHPFEFSAAGGAQMYAYDFDGDKKNEVVTSLAAHSYGLAVYKKKDPNSADGWSRIDIMTDKADTSPTGLAISQLHAIALEDVDGDGKLDIVTGKRFWAHNGHDPGENEPVLLVWFKAIAGASGLRFVPNVIDDNSGVGTQVVCKDIDKNGLLDVLSISKRGIHVLTQWNANSKTVGNQSQKAIAAIAENTIAIKDNIGGFRPAWGTDTPMNMDFETGDLRDWEATGASFFNQPVKGDTVSLRIKDAKSLHQGDYWVGSSEIVTDVGLGTLQSKPFKISKPWVSFLFAGGASTECRIEIVDHSTGKTLYQYSSNNVDTLQRVVVDSKNWSNKAVFVRLVDNNRESWGHVNFDDLRLHDEEPKLP